MGLVTSLLRYRSGILLLNFCRLSFNFLDWKFGIGDICAPLSIKSTVFEFLSIIRYFVSQESWDQRYLYSAIDQKYCYWISVGYPLFYLPGMLGLAASAPRYRLGILFLNFCRLSFILSDWQLGLVTSVLRYRSGILLMNFCRLSLILCDWKFGISDIYTSEITNIIFLISGDCPLFCLNGKLGLTTSMLHYRSEILFLNSCRLSLNLFDCEVGISNICA